MIFLAYQQFKTSERDADLQSLSNLNTATSLVSTQVEAAASKLFLLDSAKSLTQFNNTAKRILKHTPLYADVIHVNLETGQYRSIMLNPTKAEQDDSIVWTPLLKLSAKLEVSSLYEKKPGYWVFAVKYTPDSQNQIWLEFDLMHTTQSLRGLRTLNDGYVFVIDRQTERLIFHPDPNRIGSPSVSYHGGISELIKSGHQFGNYEYYYQDQFKITVFDTDNPFNWVFISGTDRSDILASSYQFGLTAIFIASLLLILGSISYLVHQLNHALAKLSRQTELAQFKQQLRLIIDRFLSHQGMQFCLYDRDSDQFSTLDFHGNSRVVMDGGQLITQLTPGEISYRSKALADPLAKKLMIQSRHYRFPLFSRNELIAVVYVQALTPSYRAIIRMIRDYSEVALANLLLHKKLLSKDVMTQLDNKHIMREAIDHNVGNQRVFFALIDIDRFKLINDDYGHKCGDKIILATAELMQTCFSKPNAISHARYGGDEFCVLFYANDENDAYDQCDLFRQLVEKRAYLYNENTIHYTISIGITRVQDSQHITIGNADKAISQAKGLGRNQVVLNTF
ncbi:hypothetical protein VII00023_11921 [Vibrio ichthyoenteri ATCC 700023]|uniref:diguanylate cyclase n=1 Tax=Vibrio ichthyoenteri ATCC 700023 TaxID=870968 RepID=F9RYT3_9VIBR|nr:diguanylate cyclase [Vibrio ichthyoenteri]EGU46293.1 hypothetical protein VII00023_11921 [Vibrio ichthyoenteri ATCC 700023]